MSIAPVITFLISIPIAYVDTVVAACFWLLGIPLGILGNRHKPDGADEYI